MIKPNFEIPKEWKLIEEGETIPEVYISVYKKEIEWVTTNHFFAMQGQVVSKNQMCWYFRKTEKNQDPSIFENVIGLSAIRLCESTGNDIAADEVRILRGILEKYLELKKTEGK